MRLGSCQRFTPKEGGMSWKNLIKDDSDKGKIHSRK